MKRLSYFLAVLIGVSALPAQAATLSATKTVAGQLSPGTTVLHHCYHQHRSNAPGK
jgi:hypothetical protein